MAVIINGTSGISGATISFPAPLAITDGGTGVSSLPGGAVSISGSQTLTNKTLTAPIITNSSGTSYNIDSLVGIPQNTKASSYTCVLSDAGKAIIQITGSTTITIPANSSVEYPPGTTLTFVNFTSGSISISITSDSLYQAGTGTLGTRTLGAFGIASAYKVTTTAWIISGAGLS